jgi:hypothetical protein
MTEKLKQQISRIVEEAWAKYQPQSVFLPSKPKLPSKEEIAELKRIVGSSF